ncbi:hypothetical protein [Candidatus Nitrosotalea sp. TS]|uniref:hypothetical protein n=1 Tax=Candidatus Nitrosotalea sp. TS TaxID=2341020 RepID=UPI00140C1DB7|nr:hypothetical protein [Candidatus Nitrosotalea sp. TS]
MLISSTFTGLMPMVHAASNLVTVTSTNTPDGKTQIQVTNSPSSTFGISSLTLQIKNGNFKSFTLGSGWIGKKTSPTTISFFASNPISPGNSTVLTISTDQSTPDLVWSAFDLNNNQLGTGEIGAPVISQNPTIEYKSDHKIQTNHRRPP